MDTSNNQFRNLYYEQLEKECSNDSSEENYKKIIEGLESENRIMAGILRSLNKTLERKNKELLLAHQNICDLQKGLKRFKTKCKMMKGSHIVVVTTPTESKDVTINQTPVNKYGNRVFITIDSFLTPKEL